jgi:hypothetical protein
MSWVRYPTSQENGSSLLYALNLGNEQKRSLIQRDRSRRRIFAWTQPEADLGVEISAFKVRLGDETRDF